jgi:hypothetical protein
MKRTSLFTRRKEIFEEKSHPANPWETERAVLLAPEAQDDEGSQGGPGRKNRLKSPEGHGIWKEVLHFSVTKGMAE